jgi:hypothetical protein
MNEDSEDPREFLRTAKFSPDAIQTLYPNARGILSDGIFVSHSGLDSQRIHSQIILPVLFDRFADGIFFHNRGSGGANDYKQLVHAALHFCDKFLVAISRSSLESGWVRAEVEWARDHSRYIIGCLLDESDPQALHPDFPTFSELVVDRDDVSIIDFRTDLEVAKTALRQVVDELLRRSRFLDVNLRSC